MLYDVVGINMGSSIEEKKVVNPGSGGDKSTQDISIKSEKEKGDDAATHSIQQDVEKILNEIINLIPIKSEDNENTKES